MDPIFFLIFGLVSVLPNTISFSVIQRRNRIFGGESTEPHEYPFAVLSLIIDKNERDYLCGGVLISSKHILTTAECVYEAIFVQTSVGLHDYYLEKTDIIYQQVDLDQYLTVHELFDPKTLNNNIALLETKEELQFSDKIQSIALPPATFSPDLLRRRAGTLIGWGAFEGSIEESFEPRHANVTILPSVICAHYYPAQDTKSSVICTDGEYKTGACIWDEGSPFITTTEDESQVLIGLVSLYGSHGCDIGWPTAYVSVASYLDWIQAKINVDHS